VDAVPSVQEYSSLQRALRESDEQFNLLVASVQDYAIFMLDTEGRITGWNAGAERIMGYRTDEVIGKHFSLLHTPEDVSQQIPERELAMAREGHCEAEGWRISKNGARFLAHIVITPLHDETGALRGYAKVTRNISTRHQLEERFRQVVESAPSAMIMINQAGIIEMVNVQAERVFGYLRTELLGQPVEMLVPSRYSAQHPTMRSSFFHDPLARPMGKGRDLYARRKDGSEFPVEIGLNPIETDEGTKVLSAIVDISDRKQKEQKIQTALEEKNILLSEIHHRVKNNLQIVHSLLDLQSTRIDDPAVLDMLRDSQNRIRSMALIHQTLYQSNDFAKVNINNVLESLIPVLMESYSVDHSRIQYSFAAVDVLLSINLAIPCGLIINELISNALKHAFPFPTSGTITVELTRQADEKILLSVSDSGVGIHSELDLHKTETLGLQLVRLLADQIGATLTIERANPTRFALIFAQER